MKRSLLWLWPLLATVACEEGPGGQASETGLTTPYSTSNGTGNPSTTSPVDIVATGTAPTLSWSFSAHPCIGNRTDVMTWDADRLTVWVGCGSTTEGTGLFVSHDAGTTWQTADASGYFDDFRVSSIQRADDGWLYVAGIQTSGNDRVVRVDTGPSPHGLEVVWESGSQIWSSFHVGTFKRNSDGVGIAESLTGSSLAYRTADDQPFQDGDGWAGGDSYQMLDMVVQDDAFYGCGSTISQPPHVFVHDAVDPLALTPVQLATWSGELWGLDVGSTGALVAGGVNQDRNVGFVFSSAGSLTDEAGWLAADISVLVGDANPTWIRGACREGAVVVGVGEYSTTENPLAVLSADGGATFWDITDQLPGAPEALHRCELWADGTLAIAGMSGYFTLGTPSD